MPDSEVEERACTTLLSERELLTLPSDKDSNINYTSSHCTSKSQGSQTTLENIEDDLLNGTHGERLSSLGGFCFNELHGCVSDKML